MPGLLWCLFVEDSEDDAQLLLRELKRGGYEVESERVETRAGMEQALARQPWDIIICDNSLPRFSAMEAIAVLKESALDIPLIIISGTIDEETAIAALKAGAHDFLAKGKLARLIPAVQRELKDARVRHERRLALESLQQSEERFRLIVESAPSAMIVVDDEGRITLTNTSVEELFGYSASELLGQPIELLVPRTSRQLHKQFVQEYLSQPRVRAIGQRVNLYGLDKAGHEIPLEIGLAPYGSSEGQRVLAVIHDITARKQAEADVATLQKRFQALIENAPDGIALLGLDGKLRQVTPSTQNILGYTLEESQGQDPALLTHPDDLPALLGLLNDLNQNPAKVLRAEYRFKHKDGSWRWLESTISNLLAEPSVEAIVFNFRDITQRKEAERALRESAIRFRSLIENSSDEISIVNAEGKLMYESPTAQPTLGYQPVEFLGQNLFQLIHPDDLERVQEQFARLMQDPNFHPRDQFRLRHRNGNWRWVEAVGTNLLSEPSVLGIVINYHDITERKRAEEQIQRQLKHLNALRMIDIAISSSFDLNTILDVVLQHVISQLGADATAVLLFNPPSQTMEYAASRGFRSDALHYTRLKLGEGHAGRAVLERKTIHIPDLMQSGGRLASALLLQRESFVDYYGAPLIVKGEVKGVLEIYHRSKLQGDPEWLEFLEMLAGQVALAIDNAELFESLQRSNAELERRVTERTQELNKTNMELEHANRAKDEFLANMSHELRTPLNSILGLSETLLEQRPDSLSEYQQRSLQIVQSSASHLLELINDILDLSKIEAGKFDYHPQSLSVDEICRSSMTFVKTQAAKKSITMTYVNEASIPRIYADPRRLKQILVNLLTNAVKFTPENGQVVLQVNTDLEQEIIRFSVIDSGIGIAPEDLQRLFQPFVQVDSSLNRQHEGTGLGLALVQRLTDLHGGSVQVESEVGKGSRFIINLSCKQEEVAEPEVPGSQTTLSVSEQVESSQAPAGGSRGVILLAEDNMANILTVGEYLESYGYEVVVAHDGLEAIEKAETMNPDIILMDIQMPALNGLDAIARLRNNARFAATPIIALTALAMPGDRERCLLAGASEFMSKPVSLKSLRQIVENLLQSRSDGQ